MCWDIFAIKNNLKHYFNDKFQRSKKFNILEKTESSGVGGKLKGGGVGGGDGGWVGGGGLDVSKSLTSRKKVMIKSVFAKKRNKTKQSTPDPTPMVSS